LLGVPVGTAAHAFVLPTKLGYLLFLDVCPTEQISVAASAFFVRLEMPSDHAQASFRAFFLLQRLGD